MRTRSFLAYGFFAISVCLSPLTANDLVDAFTNLRSTDSSRQSAGIDQLFTEGKLLASRSSEYIAEALPTLLDSLNVQENRVDVDAAGVLYLIATVRPDGATVLASAIASLNRHLDNSNQWVRHDAANALAALRPTPPPEAATGLLHCLASSEPEMLKPGIAGLLRIRPVPASVSQLIAATIDKSEDKYKADLLQAVRTPLADNPVLIGTIVSCLKLNDERIQKQALDDIETIGLPAASLSLAPLRNLSTDSRISEDLRKRAASLATRFEADQHRL